MVKFCISLLELEETCNRFLSKSPRGRQLQSGTFITTKYECEFDHCSISFQGQLCRQPNGKLRGIGQVIVTKNEKSIIYGGEWIGGELVVSFFLSDLATFNGGDKIIFRGREWRINEITTGPVTHVHVEVGSRSVGVPVTHGVNPTLDSVLDQFTNVSYEIEIDDSKPEEQFVLAEDFRINRLIRDISFASFGTLKHCKYFIEKNQTKHIWSEFRGVEVPLDTIITPYRGGRNAVDELDASYLKVKPTVPLALRN